jgi:5-methylcytosine-specific restriction endonuclease McrBC regulatory subunit McrC
MVAAALRQIGGLARLVSLPQEDLFIARALSLMFSDCYDRELLFGSRETLVREAVRLAASTQAGKERDLLYLASVVLSHESFEYGAQSTHTVPRAWFLNLENLFQVAVQRFLQENYEGKVRTAAQVGMGMPIFPEVPNAYRANPDLVFLNNGVVEAVGDVKYKIWTGAPAPSDLYQLLSHAAALGAKRSFLVFPGDQFQEKQLGVSVTGCRTWLFAIDVRDMKAQMSLLMARLGFQTDGG